MRKCSIDLWKNSAFDGASIMTFLRGVSMKGSDLVEIVPYSEMDCPREVFQKGAFGLNFVPIVSIYG